MWQFAHTSLSKQHAFFSWPDNQLENWIDCNKNSIYIKRLHNNFSWMDKNSTFRKVGQKRDDKYKNIKVWKNSWKDHFLLFVEVSWDWMYLIKIEYKEPMCSGKC